MEVLDMQGKGIFLLACIVFTLVLYFFGELTNYMVYGEYMFMFI